MFNGQSRGPITLQPREQNHAFPSFDPVPMPECTEGQDVPFTVTAKATITTVQGPCETSTQTSCTVKCKKPQIDITKTAKNTATGANIPCGSTVDPSTGITYTLTVKNTGTVDLENIRVSDHICVQNEYLGNANPTPLSEPALNGLDGEIVWVVPGSLAPGGVLTFSFNAKFPDNFDCSSSCVDSAFVSSSCGNATVRDSVSCTISCGRTTAKCWFTGGGQSTDGAGNLHSYGGVVYPGCSPTAAGGGNWNDLNHNTGVHLKGLTLHVEKCDNLPAPFPPGSSSPKTGVNYIEFNGHGYVTGLNNGNKRTEVVFWGHYEDRHEPGNSKSQPNVDLRDRYFFVAFAGSTPVAVISNDGSTDTTTSNALAHAVIITHGNMQIHQTGCDKAPKPGQLQSPDDPLLDLSTLPTELSFGMPRPNPTGTGMTLEYSLPQEAQVSAKVFDVAGRVVRDLGDSPVAAGRHMLSWDLQSDAGQRVGPGLFFVRLSVNGQVYLRNVTVVR